MIRALKVAMVVWGVIGILFGLAFVFAPEQLGNMLSYEKGPAYIPYFLGALGISYIAGSFFLILAAQDPIRHINWVKYAISWNLLSIVVGLYSISRGFVVFEQAGMGIILDAVFAVIFLILYPWRLGRVSQKEPQVKT